MSLSTATHERVPPGDWAQTRTRLAELTVLINALIAERQYLQTALDSIVYPVLTLPPEITSNIFVQSLPAETTPSPHTSPLLLAQICHQWRVIALATPHLWQSITLDRVYERNGCEKLLGMWLHHSGSLPLRLSLGAPHGEHTQSLVDASLHHSDRWQEMTIASHATLDDRNRAFPVLRKVSLSHSDKKPRTIILRNAPSLRQANLTISNAGIILNLPWEQLTSLQLEVPWNSACFEMLRKCPQLESLSHRTVGFSIEDADTLRQPHFTLESLHSLNVGYFGPSVVPHLTLPRLRHLTLSGSIRPAIAGFRALFARSSCAVKTLSIDVGGRDEELRRFFRLFPDVAIFKICSKSLAKTAASLSSLDTLPLMETLAIDSVGVGGYDSLLDVLRARRSPGSGIATLKRFNLTFRPHQEPEFPASSNPLSDLALAQFRDLSMGGLEIRIRTIGPSSSQSSCVPIN
ncbi:hypothetical protein FB451DRAFT_164623 [Mycena latifolia]|nr:hypothetical protein FB451DRAFT_164623 [Mycena latifolia]